MATINGQVLDIGLGVMYSRQVRLMFELSGPATVLGTGRMITTRRKVITPDESGNWSIVLQGTDQMTQDRHYTMTPEWLEPAPIGFADADFPVWKFKLPSLTWSFPELIASGNALEGDTVNNALWWIGPLAEGTPPVGGPPWLDPNTGDIYEWEY